MNWRTVQKTVRPTRASEKSQRYSLQGGEPDKERPGSRAFSET